MAVVQIKELRGMTRELYEQVTQELNLSGPPPGSLLHASGPMEGGWRIIEVRESEEAAQAFFGSALFQRTARSTGIAPRPSSPIRLIPSSNDAPPAALGSTGGGSFMVERPSCCVTTYDTGTA